MKTSVVSFRVFFFMALSLVFAISCSPDDGEDGAVGPQGPQGEQGIQGEQGPQGEQGDPGTANVIYSDWIASEFGSLAAAEQSEQLLVSLGVADFNISNDLLLVYGRREVNAISNNVYQLPFDLISQNEKYRLRLSEGAGFVAVYVEALNTVGGTNIYTYFDDYRYVIIPGGVSTSGKSGGQIDFSKMSYEEVLDYFNIPE